MYMYLVMYRCTGFFHQGANATFAELGGGGKDYSGTSRVLYRNFIKGGNYSVCFNVLILGGMLFLGICDF